MLQKHIFKIFLMGLLLSVYAFSAMLADKYPSYAYVFSEFGVDESYIYDRSFEHFVFKNEKKIKKFYKRSMKKGEKLLPLMRDDLMKDGLSDLFVYISMIESGFSPAIVSSKKAVGLWQFMPSTAKHYNLAVCNAVDERCDPISSTSAAIAYLQKLNEQFGKWYLAVMAYNCGEGRLKKAIRKAGGDDLSILLDENEKYLPKETREYIEKILLAAMIGENELLDYNEIQTSSLGSLVQVDVASDTKGTVKPYFVSHYVVLGDTLETLAVKYETNPEEIKIANKLEDDALTLDTLLLIPVSKALFEKMLSE